MTVLRNRLRLLPLLALGVTLAMASSAQAQERTYGSPDGRDQRSSGTTASLQITFGSTPHWTGVRGTHVQEMRPAERTSNYDVFRYGHTYYAYSNDNGRWYVSRRVRGRYFPIDDRDVPRELRRVPRNHWRNYPSAWEDRGGYQNRGYGDQSNRGYGDQSNRGYGDVSGSSARFQVTFGSAPHWSGIRGTSVSEINMAERPDFDVFRYGGNYYVYDSNRWYSSSTESGDYTGIDDDAVPSELTKISRDHWRNYPTAWGIQYDNGRRSSRNRQDQEWGDRDNR